MWETNSLEIDEAGDERASREGNVTEESRVEVLNKTLLKDLERDELRRIINERRKKLKILKEEIKTLRKKNEQVEIFKKQLLDVKHEKEMLTKESNILIKEKHITMRKSCSQMALFQNLKMRIWTWKWVVKHLSVKNLRRR